MAEVRSYLSEGARWSAMPRSTGKERDAESGNDYFGARYYASSMGRWLSPDHNDSNDLPDPVPYADLDIPQTLNLYEYVSNNPLSNIDPDGHECDQGTMVNGVLTFHCQNSRPKPKMQDGRADPGDDGLSLIVGWGVGKIIGMGVRGIFGARVATEVVTTTSEPEINITEEGLEHVLERHVAGGVRTAGKSLFNGSKADVKALLEKAGSVKPTPQANGNLARVVDAGRTIGVDRATNAPTSVYTVITKPSGDLVTAFPGRP